MIARCGACGKEDDVITRVGGLQFKAAPPWRFRNARLIPVCDPAARRGFAAGAFVLLCSDICEKRYGERIGFVDDKVQED